MRTALVDFLNHGILPFIGRSAETERILDFWRVTSEGNRLRAALLTGEAGIGKSRLVEEIIPSVVQEGGTVVHTRLYPESTASIAPLIARALHVLNTRRHLNIGDPDETLPSAIATLRRLARLRPTLLIIEDIHLLNGESLREFSLLLEGLAEEVISVLSLTRPVELPARGLLERHLVEEIELKNLNPLDLKLLWQEIFDVSADPEMLVLLHDATQGNPLAVRSALRGSMKSGVIAYNPHRGLWQSNLPGPALLQTFTRSVELLSEGMAAHLTDEERQGATAIACLGEIFSREAARAILPGADTLLDALMFKGIIITSTTHTPPLAGTASAGSTLVFTHTLLHTHLVRGVKHDANSLLRLIASDTPLYSILPFQLLAGVGRIVPDSSGEARRAIERALAVARELDASPDWKLGTEIWKAADAVRKGCEGLWSREEEQVLDAELLTTQLILLRRSGDYEEYEQLARKLEAFTAEPIPPHLLEYRLKALSFLHALARRRTPELCQVIWEGAQRFIEEHPDLRFSGGYLMYMDSAARSMLYMGDQETLRWIDEQLTSLMDDPRATAEFRHQARHIIVFHCLELFSSEEELARRLRQMEELEPHVDPGKRMSFLISKIMLLCSIGRMEEAIRTADGAIPLFREQNLTNNFYFGSLARCCARGGLGGAMEEIEEEVERLCASAPADIRNFALFAHMALIEIGLLRDDRPWLARALKQYEDAIPYLRPETQMILAMELGLPMDHAAATAKVATPAFRPLLDLILTRETPDRKGALAAVREVLCSPILQLNDLLEKQGALVMIPELAKRLADPDFEQELYPEMHDAVKRGLEWMAEHNLHPYMMPLIARYPELFPAGEIRFWRETAQEIARYRSSTTTSSTGSRTRISMLGTVEIRRPDGETIPVRGSRLRALLGLLVADRLLDTPLDHREFSAIASGSEADPERARKTLNGIVFRLRDVIGHDAVDTSAETPRLNLDLVEVDLLEAHTAMRESIGALREGSLLRSRERIARALAITRGDVPFPNLYENFFEAAREDFENELRGTLLRITKRLLMEGDPKSAEELLRSGLAVLPGDEEMAELLCKALAQLGKRVEAERIRLRTVADTA